uniref:Protein preY, mitochondrial n=1 Tax=Tetraselmis chuii TaxID=63592 RepID=A0A7S1SNE5_9CHLO|mmetsp:Transcript_21304/g.37932  ORF Transcript_21304/g.37932 Transcript_21304/m.37932 type:complete len:112 (+) Transcript_21304:115-450(+)|eukprot:CAMPEP_0177767760 /NCGR_PEP_ID=MMETSP0491_2-20121128/9318_1 /TAXON_ID=63592 /ORGANISM="Tetraselmis chuii, Strain PLY429" /LENGTH=111 /DNA_ID=CAMNT_0019284439 /DNA_START=100 /DNA_END=435 /DNA_ORIENTATION=-
MLALFTRSSHAAKRLAPAFTSAADTVIPSRPDVNARSQRSNVGGIDLDSLAALGDPLDKKPLRYDPENSELVNDRLGVAYPVVHGIPQLIPNKGRVLTPPTSDEPSHTDSY